MEDQLGLLGENTPEKLIPYRPPLSTGRLAQNLSSTDRNRDKFGHWTPSLSYIHTLEDVKNQFTPAEYYRYNLVTSGKIIRQLIRLEARWNKNYDIFVKAAVKVQSLHRGNVGRMHFNQVKDILKEKYLYRETKKTAIKLFEERRFEDVLKIISKLTFYLDLAVIKLKSQYKAQNFRLCISLADEIIEHSELNEDAYFVKACALCQLKQYQHAYEVIKILSSKVEQVRDDVVRLNGFLVSKLNPPFYQEGVDGFDYLISKSKNDLASMYRRACCNNLLQEWDKSLEDLNFVLVFKPHWVDALLLRARVLGCVRKWDAARADYNKVLDLSPGGHPAALAGLQDIADDRGQLKNDLPMLSERMVTNTEKPFV